MHNQYVFYETINNILRFFLVICQSLFSRMDEDCMKSKTIFTSLAVKQNAFSFPLINGGTERKVTSALETRLEYFKL